MNEAGAKVVAAGMKFGYHNHAFEFGGKMGERPTIGDDRCRPDPGCSYRSAEYQAPTLG